MDWTSLFPHSINEFLRSKGLGAISSNILYHKQSTWWTDFCEMKWQSSSSRAVPGHHLNVRASVQPRYSGHLTVSQWVPCTCLQCSDQSFLRWDFKHAVHLKPSSSHLLSTGAVRTLRLPLLPRCEHHEGQAYDHYQHTEAQQRDGYHQPGDSLPVGLFLRRHRGQRFKGMIKGIVFVKIKSVKCTSLDLYV